MTQVLWFVVVATLWGGTNPLIKRESQGVERIKRNSKVKQILAELYFLFSNWKYCMAFLLNQSGSVLFYLTLASVELSLAVPVTNSLTFIFTMLSGHFLGEKIQSLETFIGVAMVVLGVALCVSNKV
ncbi:Hypothetical predicted protein [Mytilus galloprovincialis]|uniref:Transmembrane protein 234 n=1 Tax=Mytilus galloprovincialis TaxID=29158 RepID=A0A8B6CUL4_MYTGA|nr:Hypothetical predicted protein [Mytilus galloprovincialis]